jgi:hypothetical protein
VQTIELGNCVLEDQNFARTTKKASSASKTPSATAAVEQSGNNIEKRAIELVLELRFPIDRGW